MPKDELDIQNLISLECSRQMQETRREMSNLVNKINNLATAVNSLHVEAPRAPELPVSSAVNVSVITTSSPTMTMAGSMSSTQHSYRPSVYTSVPAGVPAGLGVVKPVWSTTNPWSMASVGVGGLSTLDQSLLGQVGLPATMSAPPVPPMPPAPPATAPPVIPLDESRLAWLGSTTGDTRLGRSAVSRTHSTTSVATTSGLVCRFQNGFKK